MKSNKVVFYPFGPAMLGLAIIFGPMIFAGAYLFIHGVLDWDNLGWLSRLLYISLGLFVTFIGISCFYLHFYKGRVIFSDNMFICKLKEKGNSWMQEIFVDCSSITGTTTDATWLIEFTVRDGKPFVFHCARFSKKQVAQILNEIKERGGLKVEN